MKDDRKSLIFTSLAHFTNDGNFLLFPTLIAYYKFIPGVSIEFLGVMAILYNLLSGLLGSPIGKYADRINKDSLLIFTGIIIEAISVLFFGIAFVFVGEINYIILIAAILLGTGQAFYHPIGASILSFTYGKERSPYAMGINGSFGSTGRALLPSIIVYAILFFGDFNGLFIIFIYTVISAFIILSGLNFFRRSDMEEKIVNKEELKKHNKKRNLDYSKYKKFLYILTAIVFIRSIFLLGTVTFIPDYFDEIFHSKIIMGDVVTISFIGAIFGQPYFGSLTKKFGGKFTIAISTIISTIFFGILLLTDNIILVTLIYLIYVFAAFSGFPVLLGYVAQVIPSEFSTQSNALVWSFGNIVGGSVGIALVTGLLYINISLYESFIFMLIFAVVSVIMLPLLPNKNKN